MKASPDLPPRVPRTKARNAPLAERLAADFRRRITAGKLQPGDRLPTEMALCERYGISRAAVREGIARLKADGLVETRQGSGAYVARIPPRLNLRLWREAAPLLGEMHDIFELRAMIEGAVAELAARRRTPADLVAMDAQLAAMDKALAAGSDGTGADDAFHVAIATATRNAHVGDLVRFLGHHFSDTRRLTWPATDADATAPRAAQREHRALFAAIAAGQPLLARRRALEHLRKAAARVGIDLAVDLAPTR